MKCSSCGGHPTRACEHPTSKGICQRALCGSCGERSAGGKLFCPPHVRLSKGNAEVWESRHREYDATPAVEVWMLESLLANSAFLTATEIDAFDDMLEQVRRAKPLSPRQREWVKRVGVEIDRHNADLDLLDAAIEVAHDPSPFEDMRDKLVGKERRTLSVAQRDWAERVTR